MPARMNKELYCLTCQMMMEQAGMKLMGLNGESDITDFLEPKNICHPTNFKLQNEDLKA